MSDPRPLYLIGAPGDARQRVVRVLEVTEERVHDSGASFLGRNPPPGVVCLMEDGLEGHDLLRVVVELGRGEGEWTPVLIRSGDDGLRARPVSVGFSHELDDVRAFARGEDRETLLELRRIVSEMARVRHDVNNPLTSALAEVQLLLMDEPTGELGEALETIQTQLRRIRDMVGDTRYIRNG